tara:strand:- start:502 stop:654 length:153 start_codon:yes stop_codon:yes gene_type:complete
LSKEFFYWTIWVILVVIWNYGYPQATPFQDVLIAVFLSLAFILIKKKFNK